MKPEQPHKAPGITLSTNAFCRMLGFEPDPDPLPARLDGYAYSEEPGSRARTIFPGSHFLDVQEACEAHVKSADQYILSRSWEGSQEAHRRIASGQMPNGNLAGVTISNAKRMDDLGAIAYVVGFVHRAMVLPLSGHILSVSEIKVAMEAPYFLFHAKGWPNAEPFLVIPTLEPIRSCVRLPRAQVEA